MLWHAFWNAMVVLEFRWHGSHVGLCGLDFGCFVIHIGAFGC